MNLSLTCRTTLFYINQLVIFNRLSGRWAGERMNETKDRGWVPCKRADHAGFYWRSLRGTSTRLIGTMVRSAKVEFRTSMVRVIMRQTEGWQDNLNDHVEGRHVFVVHRGGGPCGWSTINETKIRKECRASELPWVMLTSTGVRLRCTRA